MNSYFMELAVQGPLIVYVMWTTLRFALFRIPKSQKDGGDVKIFLRKLVYQCVVTMLLYFSLEEFVKAMGVVFAGSSLDVMTCVKSAFTVLGIVMMHLAYLRK